jgi:hypothetical protein
VQLAQRRTCNSRCESSHLIHRDQLESNNCHLNQIPD